MLLNLTLHKFPIHRYTDRFLEIYTQHIPYILPLEESVLHMATLLIGKHYNVVTACKIGHESYKGYTKTFDLAFNFNTRELLTFGETSENEGDIIGIYFPQDIKYLDYCFHYEKFDKHKIKIIKCDDEEIIIELVEK